MSTRKEIFIDEASELLDELQDVIDEMRADGVCLSEEIRKICKQLDDVWAEVSATEEEDELEEEE